MHLLPVTTTLIPYRCEANCKPVNASDEVVLSVSGQKDSQAIYYNWYLDNTFQTKVRASGSSEILHTHKKTHPSCKKATWLRAILCQMDPLEIIVKTETKGCLVWEGL